jgi:hypothetical protein
MVFLMSISLGQSQTLRLGFESGESGNVNNPFGGMALPTVVTGTGSNTTSVLSITAGPGGDIWQGCNFLLTSPVELTSTKTMTIEVLSSAPVTFLLKVNGGVSGAPEAAAVASHNGDGTWQTISFTFNTALDGKAATANGVYENMVIHPFWTTGQTAFSGSPSARSFFIDNIKGPASTSTVIVNPTIAAPTPPTRVAGDVMNYYSNAYTEIAGTDWNPNWGQSTAATEISVVGNATRKMQNLNYQGAQFATAQNVSAMSTLHLDVWTPDCNSFKVFLISPGPIEQGVTLTPTLSGWNSFDIPLSSYTAPNKSDIIQFKFESVTPGTTVYLDNIYFWKAATLPVSLTEFKATKNGNSTLLNWRTESESNNKGFALERSENGIDWTQIQFVNGNGTTSTAKNYFATDNNPINGLNYYRLVQIDYDGKQTNSAPLSVKFSFAQQIALSFYPNPAKNNLTVFLDKLENNDATLELISVEGKKIKTIKLNKQDANNSISIDLKGFDKGIYLLSLKDGANSKTSKLLID